MNIPGSPMICETFHHCTWERTCQHQSLYEFLIHGFPSPSPPWTVPHPWNGLSSVIGGAHPKRQGKHQRGLKNMKMKKPSSEFLSFQPCFHHVMMIPPKQLLLHCCWMEKNPSVKACPSRTNRTEPNQKSAFSSHSLSSQKSCRWPNHSENKQTKTIREMV